MNAKILIVDDEPGIRKMLEIFLSRAGYVIASADSISNAIVEFDRFVPDLVITDLKLPDSTGIDLLNYAKSAENTCEVIMMTAFATTQTAVEAMRAGAYDYVIKPFEVDELALVIDRALERKALQQENSQLRSTLDARSAQNRLIGKSDAMREVSSMIAKVAAARTTILLTGESGTGKELVARAIHSRSDARSQEPFVPINCGAIPESLIESELFGHVKGAFTGATSDRAGYFESAGHGTVFLDEIGELPLHMQVRLLRVLQERRLQRVGGHTEIDLHCRVIAATNRDLEIEIAEDRFREDLYFRLNVIQIPLPSLKERKDDIPILAPTFVAKFCEEQGRPIATINDDAMEVLLRYDWPGNVRELENAIERAVTLNQGDEITPDDLPVRIRETDDSIDRGNPVLSDGDTTIALPEDGLDLESMLEGIERRLIHDALMRTQGKKKKAADLLGLSFRSFRYRTAKLGIDFSRENTKASE